MSDNFRVATVKHHVWGSVITFTQDDANNPAQFVAVTFNPDEAIRKLQPGTEISIVFKPSKATGEPSEATDS